VSVGSIIKSVSAGFADAFWQGFEEARAESGATAQPAPANPFESEAVKAALIDVVRAAYANGVAAERARTSEILNAPGAPTFHEIASDLLLGDATAAQAAAVLSRASADAATRAAAIKSNLLESANVATLH
jgi:hypothetical protein